VSEAGKLTCGRVQPGSLDSEAGIFAATFDQTGSRLITGEADKTIKASILKHSPNALTTHPHSHEHLHPHPRFNTSSLPERCQVWKEDEDATPETHPVEYEAPAPGTVKRY